MGDAHIQPKTSEVPLPRGLLRRRDQVHTPQAAIGRAANQLSRQCGKQTPRGTLLSDVRLLDCLPGVS